MSRLARKPSQPIHYGTITNWGMQMTPVNMDPQPADSDYMPARQSI